MLHHLLRLAGVKTNATHSRTSGARSPHWRSVEKAHIAKQPDCQVCGTPHHVEVHHCLPFHLRPKSELDPTNLITLCRPHHLLAGHLMNWHSYNAEVRSDAHTWSRKISRRPAA